MKLPWERTLQEQRDSRAETNSAKKRIRAAMKELEIKLDEADKVVQRIQEDLNRA